MGVLGMKRMHTQTKRESLIEAVSNTTVGFIVNAILYHLIFSRSYIESISVVLFFTVISIARTYVIRRLFEKWNPKY